MQFACAILLDRSLHQQRVRGLPCLRLNRVRQSRRWGEFHHRNVAAQRSSSMNAIVESSAGDQSPPEFEGEIKEFVRRDVTFRRKRSEPSVSNAAVDNVNSVIQRVAGASFDEIDCVIAALQTMKDTLRQEGERVQREIVGYASLSHSAATSMKVIAESLLQWKPGQIHQDVG
jgi:hypothetical protein